MERDCYQDYLEWEYIDTDIEITNLKFENNHYGVNEDAIIKFHRNSRFKLVATMTNIKTSHQLRRDHGAFGSFIEKENILGVSKYGDAQFKLTGIVMGAANRDNSSNANHITYKANIIFDSIEKIFKKSKEDSEDYESTRESETLCEWYLCGKSSFNFPRSTLREAKNSYIRARYSIDKEDFIEKGSSYSITHDYFVVKNDRFSFIVGKVPDQYGPEWSSKIVVEYRKSFGEIPNKEDREAVSELISFFYGNQFIKIGESEYDSREFFTKQIFQNSFSKDAISICQSTSFTPVDFQGPESKLDIEILLASLLSTYLKQRNSLVLGGAIAKFWLAKSSELGANLPILSSAVESLSEKYLEFHPFVKPYYINYDEFIKLVESELSSIEKKLKDNPYSDAILKRIKNTSQRSLTNKLDQMLEQLGISIGKIERQAIIARHKMAHTSFNDISEDEVKHLLRLTKAYETLFRRIILKILDYKGDYIDYYTLGFPNRNIDDFIPESSG